jgi:hypothetical protein
MNPNFKKVFPSNHPCLNSGDPSLLENLRAKISVFKVLPTSLSLKKKEKNH